jgi:hypothetical protein
MFSSDILEVAVGTVFVFVLISTICSAVREGIEAWLKTRAAYLELGLQELLQDSDGKGLVSQVFNHPLVDGLFSGDFKPRKKAGRPRLLRGGRNLPSYIPSRNFALAIMDIAARGPVPTSTPQGSTQVSTTAAPAFSLSQVRAGAAKFPDPAVRRGLLLAIDTAHGDVNHARANIEAWYDSTMERVSGWYKRSTQRVLFWVALVIVVSLNVNTLTIADYLYRHSSERSSIVSTIDRTVATRAEGTDQAGQASPYQTAQQRLDEMHLPLGWANGWGYPHARSSWPKAYTDIRPWDDVFQPLIGWLITAFAATLGAPFWFDVLGKIMVVRSTAKPAGVGAGAVSGASQLPAPMIASQQTLDEDAHSSGDTCGVGAITPTPDELLPVARGGVA